MKFFRKPRPNTGRILLLLLPLGILLSACSDGGSPTGSSAAKPTQSGSPASAGGLPQVTGNPVTTASGLQYIDSKVGDGPEAKSGSKVTVNYTGYLTNGKKFDSSLDRNQPFSFPLGGGRVIKGWDEGVAGMKVGGKRRLIIPSALGYGARGAGADIPPNSDLVFDVDLLGVEAPAADTGAPPVVNGTPVKTASGLQYIDSKVGDGPEAKAGQSVTVNYTGYLTNGKKFDSSLDSGQPFSFGLGAGQVIKGWDEGVAGMKVGGKRRLIIPAALGYGAQGAGGVIPPNADLVFDVDLLGVK